MATAAIVAIGNETLSGKTKDANTRSPIDELRKLSLALKLIVVIPEDPEQIAKVLREASYRYDYVFTSGGIEPTHDDATLAAVYQALFISTVRNPKLEESICKYLGDKLTEEHLMMAIPQGSPLVTAEGLKWPAPVYKYVLPGVLRFFRKTFSAIRERFRTAGCYLKVICTMQDEFETERHLTINDNPNITDGDNVKATIE